LDLVALKYAARLNSLTALVITKLDVFSGFETIKVCTRYRSEEGATFEAFPYHQSVVHHAVGEYTELPGWSEDISKARSEAELPKTTREYLRFIANFVDVPVVLVGVGPGRDQIIWTGEQPAALAA
jgi:adenylosuccinate synthase